MSFANIRLSKTLLVLLPILVVQLGIISFLFIRLFQNKQNVLGVSNIIDKSSINFTSSDLQYFYEPTPKQIQKENKAIWKNTYAEYSINNDSLNERYDYSVHKDENTFRIVTLGDSFTFGMRVNTQFNYTEILEDFLNQNACDNIRFEIINLGMMGYDIIYSVERYKKRGQKYNPDLVILYIVDDFSQYLEKSIPSEQGCIETISERGETKENNSCSQKSFEYLQENYSPEYRIRAQEQSLDELLSLVSKNTLILFHTSNNETINNTLVSKGKNNKRVFLYSDMEEVFRSAELSFIEYGDSHPNKKGHRKIAQNILGTK